MHSNVTRIKKELKYFRIVIFVALLYTFKLKACEVRAAHMEYKNQFGQSKAENPLQYCTVLVAPVASHLHLSTKPHQKHFYVFTDTPND